MNCAFSPFASIGVICADFYIMPGTKRKQMMIHYIINPDTGRITAEDLYYSNCIILVLQQIHISSSENP